MPKIIGPSVSPRVRPDISPRPLPRSVVDVYALTERDFRRLTKELEKDERFKELIDKGVLRKVRLKGRIPQHKYEEYMDEALVAFLKDNGVTDHYDWQKDFFDSDALKQKHRLARKYGVPVGKLVPILRYCEYLRELGTGARSMPVNMDVGAPDFLKFSSAPQDLFDTRPVVERIRKFVERFDLSMEEFRDLFFCHQPDENVIAEKIGASFPEIRAILGLVERVQVLNAFQLDVQKPTRSAGREKVKPVAEFVHGSQELDVTLRFLSDDVYDVKYRFAMPQERESSLSRHELDFIDRLKAVNQRKNLLCRIIIMVFRYQYRFLLSGDYLDLQPLKQTQAAQTLNEEEASISRLIRDKYVRLPDDSVVSLKFFFRKIGDTVGTLINELERREVEAGRRKRPFTDVELQRILAERYGVKLSRRSITYHRNKTMKGANYYARCQNIAKKEGESG